MLLWVGISAYYYYQHIVTVEQSEVDEKISLQEGYIEIENFYIADWKRRQVVEGNWLAQAGNRLREFAPGLVYRLPGRIDRAVIRLGNFYIDPYQRDLDYHILSINAKIVDIDYDDFKDLNFRLVLNDRDDVFEIYRKQVIVDYYGPGRLCKRFRFKKEDYPYYEEEGLLKLIIEDNGEELTTLTISPQWEERTYNYIDRIDPITPVRINDKELLK